MMQRMFLSVFHQKKILDSVVKFIMINVVDNFRRLEFSSEMSFHYKTVLRSSVVFTVTNHFITVDNMALPMSNGLLPLVSASPRTKFGLIPFSFRTRVRLWKRITTDFAYFIHGLILTYIGLNTTLS